MGERTYAVNDFLELLEYVNESLFKISNWKDIETSSQASKLRTSVMKENLIICLLIVTELFSSGLPLSKQLKEQIYLYNN